MREIIDYDYGCRCQACKAAEEANEIKGPLPNAFLADMIDHEAGELADIAGELNILHVKYERSAGVLREYSKFMVELAKIVREDGI